MRVLITGSRSWRDGQLIRSKLEECLSLVNEAAEAMPRPDGGDVLTVVHGACRSGADQFADGWTRWHVKRGHRVARETYPAQWDGPCRDTCRPGHRRNDPRGWNVCPQAGFFRNEEMVALGADLCLAFIADNSKGASHCAEYADKAGIEVRYFRADLVARLF